MTNVRDIDTARSAPKITDAELYADCRHILDTNRIITDPNHLIDCHAELLTDAGPFFTTGGDADTLIRIALIAQAALCGPAEIGAALDAIHKLVDRLEGKLYGWTD